MNCRSLFLLLLVGSFFSTSTAQIQIDWLEITEEDGENDNINLYATNKGYCPLTISMDFSVLENLKADRKLPAEVVIPNDGEAHHVVTLKPTSRTGNLAYNFQLAYSMGDALNAKPNKNHAYLLPFSAGKSYRVGQGYNGHFSHSGINALDFNMPEGSNICATRAGTVVTVKEDSNSGCKSSKCKDQANYILIYHKDGTFASYVHLKFQGAKVKPGDKIEAGQVIGLSGNTGWSSGPHLHLEIYQPGPNNQRISLPTKFLIAQGKKAYLKEEESYTAIHP